MAAAATGALLASCATFRDRPDGDELVGRTVRMETVRGETTLLRFRRDATVRAQFRGRSLNGQWRVEGRRLCFYWPRAPRECWPYRRAFERGRTRTLTSDRGNRLRVTML